jgi:hypothetical protein
MTTNSQLIAGMMIRYDEGHGSMRIATVIAHTGKALAGDRIKIRAIRDDGREIDLYLKPRGRVTFA